MNQKQRKHIAMIVIVLCGCMPFYSCAQTSTTFTYPNLSIDPPLLCTDPHTGNDIVYYSIFNTNERYFFYHDQGTGSTKQFRLVPNGGPINLYEEIIRDFNVKSMIVCGTYCYFCGILHTYTLSEIFDPEDDRGSRDYINLWEGFLGRFPMSEIRNPACTSLTMQYMTIPDTKMLHRLETNDTLLAVIVEYISGDHGFVVMKETGTSINYLKLYSQDNYERVSDISFNSNSLAVVSSFTNDDYLFGIRDGNSTTLNNLLTTQSPPTFFNTIYKYNTSNLNMFNYPGYQAPTKEITHDIRISSENLSNTVVVVYEATGDGPEDSCGNYKYEHNTNLYQCTISTSGILPAIPAMITAQIVSHSADYINGLSDVRYLSRLYKVALLYNSLNNAMGVASMVQYPKLPTPGTVECQFSPIDRFSSMDIFGIQSIQLVGRRSGNNPLTHFMQNLNLSGQSCLPLLPSCNSVEMSLPELKITESIVLPVYGNLMWSNPNNLPERTLQCTRTCTLY